MTNALRIYGNDASTLDFEVKTTQPMPNAQVHFHHAGMGLYLQLASLPATLTGTFTPSSPTTSMRLELEASRFQAALVLTKPSVNPRGQRREEERSGTVTLALQDSPRGQARGRSDGGIGSPDCPYLDSN